MLQLFKKYVRRALQTTTSAVPAPHLPIREMLPEDRDLMLRIRAKNLTYLKENKFNSLGITLRQIEAANLPGIFIEAGCALGGSSIFIGSIKKPQRPLYVYDVFGMIPPPTAEDTPEVHERYRIIVEGKSQGIGGDNYYGYVANLYEVVQSNLQSFGLDLKGNSISLVKGMVQDTLHVNQPVAFAHFDVDWYDPVMTCLTRIFPHLVIGGSIILDDYHCWGGCKKATDEYLKKFHDQIVLEDSTGAMKVTRVKGDPLAGQPL